LNTGELPVKRFILLAVVMLSICQSAGAAVITFTSQAAWEAAVGAGTVTQENFNGPEINPIPEGVLTDLGDLNVIYTSGDSTDNASNQLDGGNNNRLQLRWDTLGTNNTTSMTLTFDSAIGAFGGERHGRH
jgi:hypothetical protein